MKLSIITVVFNGATTIADTIRSVATQTYPDIEYIVIDGGSTDGTQAIVESFGELVSVFVCEPDKGIYDAMNKGLRLAKGDVIGILNADDYYANNDVLQEIAAAFIEDPGAKDVAAVYGDLVYVDAAQPNKIVRYWRSRPMYPTFFEDGNVPPHPTLFVRREVYTRIGEFDSSFKLAADHEFMLRLFRIERLTGKHIPRVLVRMRLGGDSNSSFGNILRGNQEIVRAWQKNGLKVPPFAIIKRLWQRLRQYTQRPGSNN